MLNRKTHLGVAIIIIICLSIIMALWLWYGQEIAQLNSRLAASNHAY